MITISGRAVENLFLLLESFIVVLWSSHSARKSPVPLLLIGIALSVPGCDGEKSEEISAATSGYKPIDANAAGSKDSGKESASSVKAPDSAPAVKSTQESTTPGGLTKAPELPDFQPGKIDPAIAKRDFMQLVLPKTDDPKVLAEYLGKNMRSVRELIAEGQKKTITREVVLQRGMQLLRDRVTAADKLKRNGTTDEEKSNGSLAKIEALAQMTSMGDIASTDELRAVVASEAESEFPVVAEQASALVLAFSINDLETGAATAEDVGKIIDKVLASKSLGKPALNSVATAIDAIEKKSGGIQEELARKVEKAFRNNEDPSVSIAAWQLLAQRVKSMEELLGLLDPSNPDSRNAELVESKGKAALEDVPSPWTAFYLAKNSTDLEYSGRIEAAKVLVKLAESQLDSLPSEEAKQELKETCEKFWKRTGILGAEIDFSGLADLEGKAFDFSEYKGKVVVLDFWATWCGPCIEEIPNIRAMYEKRQSQGAEVLGINIDNERDRLMSFLESEKLPWKTLVSSSADLQGFETPMVSRLGIGAIPFIAVIDKEGKVAAIHVRGRALDTKVAELLGVEVETEKPADPPQ